MEWDILHLSEAFELSESFDEYWRDVTAGRFVKGNVIIWDSKLKKIILNEEVYKLMELKSWTATNIDGDGGPENGPVPVPWPGGEDDGEGAPEKGWNQSEYIDTSEWKGDGTGGFIRHNVTKDTSPSACYSLVDMAIVQTTALDLMVWKVMTR